MIIMWWKMMVNPTSTSCGMIQSMPALRLLQSCNQQMNTSTSKYLVSCTNFFIFCSPFYQTDLHNFKLYFWHVYFNCRFCTSCTRLDEIRQKEIPKVFDVAEDLAGKVCYNMATKNGTQYKIGDGVLLLPDAFMFRYLSCSPYCVS